VAGVIAGGGDRGGRAAGIAAEIERAVAAGELAPGERLPPVRRLASQLGVSPTTVAAALAELRRRGVVVSRPRSGTRVSERPPLRAQRAVAATPPGVRDRAAGNPDPALLPDLAPVLRALPATHRLYGEPPLEPALAEAAAPALAADGIDAGRLGAVSGALDGIERVLAAHLTVGDTVAVEDPGWPGVLDLVRALGLRLAPVAVDDRGIRPDALAAALRAGARAAVLTPRAHNPTGAALDAARTAELTEVLAAAPGALVVEDDHLGPVAGVPWRSLAGGRERWAVVRSVSKWLGPDLRLAVLAGDDLTLARVEGRQSLGPGWVSGLLQRLAGALWADPAVAKLVERAAAVYASRREALVTALAAHGIAVSAPSGLNLWVPVPDEDAAVRGLLAAGASVAAGAPFRLGAGPAVRITTAGLEPGEPEALAAALAAAVSPPRRTRAA
jgi:DNA-binding transcriptional MocR family regulator